MSKFEIDEDSIPSLDSDVELVDEHLQRALQEYAKAEGEVVATALLRGYDGVDIKHKNQTWSSAPMQRLEVEAWMGEPPRRRRVPRGITRYYFRPLSKKDKQRLLSIIGATLDDINDQAPENV